MPIRFKCSTCQKTLVVKDELAGRRAKCPACKNPVVIPAPTARPADVEDLASKALADPPPTREPEKPAAERRINFACEFCETAIEVPFSEGGKRMPCPECRQILRVPLPDDKKPKDWRDVGKNGLSAALANQPKQLEQAWGTETKAKVSRRALEEAGAILEEEDDPPELTDWLRRGFIAATVLAVLGFAVFQITQSQGDKNQDQDLNQAIALAASHKDNMPAVWRGQIQRIAGEIASRREAPLKKVQEHFRAAVVRPGTRKEDPEVDIYLLELALAQVEVPGTYDDVLQKKSLRWEEDEQEILKTLRNSLRDIQAVEARILACRLICSRLIEKNRADLAVGLAGQLQDVGKDAHPLWKCELAGLFAAFNRPAEADKLLPPWSPSKTGDPYLRAGHVVRLCRLYQYKEAGELADGKMPAFEKLQANLAGATLALADRKTPDALQHGQAFFDRAVQAIGEFKAKPPNSWTALEMIRLGGQAGKLEAVQDWVKLLEGGFKNQAQTFLFQAQMTKAVPSATAISSEIPDKNAVALAILWSDWARQSTNQGPRPDPKDVAMTLQDERVQPLIYGGIAWARSVRPR